MFKRSGRRCRIFTGWWSVIFIGVISGLGHGFNVYGFSVFFKPIAAELGLNRALTSVAAGIGRVEGGIISPLAGWLSDRFGPRWVVLIGMTIAGSGMVMMYFINSVWQYYLAWGALIGLGLIFGLSVAVDKSINDWFVRRRGLAQGIKFGLLGLFGVIILQIINPMNIHYGWRLTCLVWGLFMFLCLPPAFFLVKPHRPEYYGLLPDGAGPLPGGEKNEDIASQTRRYVSEMRETEFTFRQAVRTRAYWLLVIAIMVNNFVAGGFNVHIFPFLTDIGISEATAGGMMGMMVFFTIPSRFFSGIIADRLPKNCLQLLLVAAFLLQVIGIGTYLLFKNLAEVYILLVCHGLSSGMVMPVMIIMLGNYFGRNSFGSILGTMVSFLAPLGLLSPLYYGWVFDVTGNYDVAFYTALALVGLACVVSMAVQPPGAAPVARGWRRFCP